jgi:hypothetical protein
LVETAAVETKTKADFSASVEMTILLGGEKRTSNSKDKMRGFFAALRMTEQKEKATAKGALVAFGKGDFEGVDWLAVADAFELAV